MQVSLWIGPRHGQHWHQTHFISRLFWEWPVRTRQMRKHEGWQTVPGLRWLCGQVGMMLVGEIPEFPMASREMRFTSVPLSSPTAHLHQDLPRWHHPWQRKVESFNSKDLRAQENLKQPLKPFQVSVNFYLPPAWQGLATMESIDKALPLTRFRPVHSPPPDEHVKTSEHSSPSQSPGTRLRKQSPSSTRAVIKVMAYLTGDWIWASGKCVNTPPPVPSSRITIGRWKGSELLLLFFYNSFHNKDGRTLD